MGKISQLSSRERYPYVAVPAGTCLAASGLPNQLPAGVCIELYHLFQQLGVTLIRDATNMRSTQVLPSYSAAWRLPQQLDASWST
jgi:hypothetical protein